MSKMHEIQCQLCVHLWERSPPECQDHCLGISCLSRTAGSRQPCCSNTQTRLPPMRTRLSIVGDTVYFYAALCSPVSFRSLACLQSTIHCKIVSSKEWKATPFLRGKNTFKWSGPYIWKLQARGRGKDIQKERSRQRGMRTERPVFPEWFVIFPFMEKSNSLKAFLQSYSLI